MIELRIREWNQIKAKLAEDFPPSTIMIRSKMKETLGFTVREHNKWIESKLESENVKGYIAKVICLDFYNDSAESWFRLKYLNISNNES